MAVVAQTQKKIFVGFSTIETNSKNQQFADIALIKRDLLNQLNTLPDERVMMPGWGCGVWNLLFEQFDEATVDSVRSEVTKTINSDPRVTLQSIDVQQYNQGLVVQVTLVYQPYGVIDTFSVQFDQRAVAMS